MKEYCCYRWRSILTSIGLSVALFLGAGMSYSSYSYADNWSHWGGDSLNNSHYNADSGISRGDVKKIEELCKIDYTAGAVIDTPTIHSSGGKPIIVGDVIYWTAFSGKVGAHKVHRDSNGKFMGCSSLWVKDVSDTLGILSGGLPVVTNEPAVRNSPSYYLRDGNKGTLVYTAVASAFTLPFSQWFTIPPYAFALDADTGAKLWQIPIAGPSALDPDAFFPSTTGSPRVHDGVAYVGLASLNNALNGPPFNLPLLFRGQMIAIDLGLNNGGIPSIKWKQYTIPPRPASYLPGTWFSGGGVWTSAPSIIPDRGLVVFGSGQLYNGPDFTENCMLQPEVVTTADFSTTLKGETGGGAAECYDASVAQLHAMGINEPLAPNSIIALNMSDGSYAWHVPTAGIDIWQGGCGLDSSIPCNTPVAGPDWDVSGNAPTYVKLEDFDKSNEKAGYKKDVVISHNKSGQLFWIDANTGELLKRADVCVGSSLGGIHWGVAYDADNKTLLVPCSAGGNFPPFGGLVRFRSDLADGRQTCGSGYLNGIDVRSGELLWQSVGAPSETLIEDAACPTAKSSLDERFKHGLDFDVVIKNQHIPGIMVNEMPDSNMIPLAGQHKANSNGTPAVSKGVAYWGVYYGAVYALDSKTGEYMHGMYCDEGAVYSAGPSVANGLVSFGCGYGFAGGAPDSGSSYMIFGLPK